MHHRIWTASAALLVLGAVTVHAQTSSALDILGRLDESAPLLRNCGTPRPEPADLERVERARRQFGAERLTIASGGTIKVAFHVITSNRLGNVTDGQIAEQIAVLNHDYQGTGYSFELATIDRTVQPGWFNMTVGRGPERHAKQALARDPAHYLNIYTCGPGQGILGWAYYPWSFPEGDVIHGVVLHYGSLPGGYLNGYNLGKTATHEVGHYLGLLHTFEGGCAPPGDYIDDTAAEAVPAFGCPEGRNTCPDPDPDPIHNFMDYTDDACLDNFTSGQDARMDAVVPVYRPSLFYDIQPRAMLSPEIQTDALHPADQVRAIEFRGAAPNPFHYETAVRFTLPQSEHVSLKVYNVAGQMVRTLIDAALPAGAHSAMFAARDLPAGLYFFSLRVGRAQMTRSAILLQ